MDDLKGKWRLEVRWSNGDFTAFPNVLGKSIIIDGDDKIKIMSFVYGEKRSVASVNLCEARFFELIKESKCK